ncbi:MAG: GlsB/YeaQ/YmgE family stress response membrane protein, partial [Mesorhizobium sp.]
MDVNGVGWIAAIIIGGLAGWLAEMVMKSNTGIFMNIILGIVGAIVLN